MDFEQTLTITMKTSSETITVNYTKPEGIASDELFWVWFVNVWPMLGLDFVKEGIEEND